MARACEMDGAVRGRGRGPRERRWWWEAVEALQWAERWEGRKGGGYPKLLATLLDLLKEPEQHVRVQGPRVRLVHHDDRVAGVGDGRARRAKGRECLG